MAMSRTDWEDTDEGKRTQRYANNQRKDKFHRLSTCRFILKGNKVSRVLIHLPSITLGRHGSWLEDSSITMTVMSDSKCAHCWNTWSQGGTWISLLNIAIWSTENVRIILKLRKKSTTYCARSCSSINFPSLLTNQAVKQHPQCAIPNHCDNVSHPTAHELSVPKCKTLNLGSITLSTTP